MIIPFAADAELRGSDGSILGGRMTKHVIIMLQTGNDAFADDRENYEIAEILARLSERYRIGAARAGDKIRDSNGNTCGEIKEIIIEVGQ